MDFDFTEEQLLLRQITRELLSVAALPARTRQLAETPDGYDQGNWGQLAELGLLGITIPEAYGGQGLGQVEQALVLDEMGRAALPSPYFATSVLATAALLAGSSDAMQRRYLPEISTGR